MRVPRMFDRRRREYEELVTRHLDGLLDAAGEARLQEVLDADSTLAAEARELEAVRALLRAEPLVEVPRSFALPYAPARVVDRPRPGALRWMQAATATAALVLVALIGTDLVGLGAGGGPETTVALDAAVAEDARAIDSLALPAQAPAPAEAEARGFAPVPEAQPADAPSAAPAAGRSALDWAQLAFGVITAVMALGVALLSWRAGRQPT